MKPLFRRLLPLLLALLMLVAPALADSDIRTLGSELALAASAYNDAAGAKSAADQAVKDLEKQYEKNNDDPDIQDALIEAMIAQEDAEYALLAAQAALSSLQAEHQLFLQGNEDLETWELEHDGKYADLAILVTLDADLVIWDLQLTVDGSERDQAAADPAFLYQFLGHDLPITMGNGKKDDVKPVSGAQTTAQDLVDTLNSLIADEKDSYQEPQGPITDPQGIADHIFRYGKLPDNFITKKEAQKLGWDSSYNYVGDVAPGKSIGGDRFGNYEGKLPDKKGRTWYEADCYYEGRKRNSHRILFSSDGLVYYTDDHYETFTQMFPSWE